MSLLLLVMYSGVALHGAGTPEPRETNDARNDKAEEGTTPRAAVEPMRATNYSEEFASVPTASGELYDPNGFTAPYLPFGTRILVSHEGQSAVVIPEESDLDLLSRSCRAFPAYSSRMLSPRSTARLYAGRACMRSR